MKISTKEAAGPKTMPAQSGCLAYLAYPAHLAERLAELDEIFMFKGVAFQPDVSVCQVQQPDLRKAPRHKRFLCEHLMSLTESY
jgi:hypothetical protein